MITFEHKGMDIHNPFFSSCGRFAVSSFEYGFVEIISDGKIKALRKDLDNGQYLLVSDKDGQDMPEEWQSAYISLYSHEDVLLERNQLKE
jgi:hypothetical protein